MRATHFRLQKVTFVKICTHFDGMIKNQTILALFLLSCFNLVFVYLVLVIDFDRWAEATSFGFVLPVALQTRVL